MIQKRYGWTDSDIMDLSVHRFTVILETIMEAKQDEQRESMVEGAFIAWQMGMTETTFRDYLEQLGLVKKMPQSMREAERKKQAEKARENAERIIQLDKRRK